MGPKNPVWYLANRIKEVLGLDRTMTAPGNDVIDAVNKQSDQIVNVATVISGTTNNSAHVISSEEYFVANGAKYKATATIDTGATWSDKSISVSDHDLINALNSNIATLNEKTFKGIDIGSCSSMTALKAALCALAQNQGLSTTVDFRFYPDFTDTGAGFYPTSYGERMGTMYIRNETRFTCIITFFDGTVTRMSNNDGTWHVDQLAFKQ